MRHASLRQRNSSASEQLSPLISSGGEFSATDSDGALMSPPGCGTSDPTSSRQWPNATVDIFGEALSPPSAGGGATTGGPAGSSEAGSSRRSFEERIRALDAKFSALDQMIKGAKERPQQPIRQTPLSASVSTSATTPSTSLASGSNVDYSKYKVVKKPSVCGVPSSPSVPASNSVLTEGLLNRPGGGLLNIQRTSAFDYDSQRLLGSLAMGTPTLPLPEESALWSQTAAAGRPTATTVR